MDRSGFEAQPPERLRSGRKLKARRNLLGGRAIDNRYFLVGFKFKFAGIACHGPTIAEDIQRGTFLSAITADAVSRQSDAPNVEKLAQRIRLNSRRLDMDDPGTVMSMDRGDKSLDPVDADRRGDPDRTPIHKDIQMLMKMEGAPLPRQRREAQESESLSQPGNIRGPRSGRHLQARQGLCSVRHRALGATTCVPESSDNDQHEAADDIIGDFAHLLLLPASRQDRLLPFRRRRALLVPEPGIREVQGWKPRRGSPDLNPSSLLAFQDLSYYNPKMGTHKMGCKLIVITSSRRDSQIASSNFYRQQLNRSIPSAGLRTEEPLEAVSERLW